MAFGIRLLGAVLGCALIFAGATTLRAQEGEAALEDIGKVKALEDGAKRDWLLRRMTAAPPGARRGAEIRERLGRLGARDMDRLIEAYYQQLALARANLRRRGGISPYGYRYPNRGVGYAPVITWLPTGTSLRTGAVVSPDGRYVRINAQPFFSSVPYYDTFNMVNGQTRRFYVQQPPPRRPTAPYRYHDGLRTHYKPPQYEKYSDGLRTRYRLKPQR